MGDDLGDDFDYLTGKVQDDGDDGGYNFAYDDDKKKSALKSSTVAVVEDDDSDAGEKKSKRKRTKENGEKEETVEPSKRVKQKPSRSKLLVEASKSIETDPSEKQAAFLWTTLVHYHQLKSGKEGETVDETSLDPKLQAFHFSSSKNDTMEARLRECMPSKKQLKNWKHRQSPCVIIVCLSARRAVQVLKELKPFKTRAAKLFAKHMQVSEQEQWLRDTAFSIAVGTPHRLQILAEKGALKLSQTKTVVLDAHKDSKSFTVCTLPDTAPHCSEFLREQVLPALKARPKELKLAFC